MVRGLYIVLITITFNAYAKSITEFQPYNYEVVFTNPECEGYKYNVPVLSNDGNLLVARPENVFCKKEDRNKNLLRQSTPNYKIRSLIADKNVKELFLTFLSFSDEDVANELCKAVEQRNIKVTFIVDSSGDTAAQREKALKMFNKVGNCRADNTLEENINIPRMELRGNVEGLGFAHNKLILAHYDDPNKVTIVFGSANMSAGTLTHHENWHFLTTSKKTHFYKAHECLREGMLEHGSSKESFETFIKDCRASISIPLEDDIELFMIPGDGKVAMDNLISNTKKAQSVDIAVHRFSHQALTNAIANAAKVKPVRFVADDDLYWSARLQKRIGANTKSESVFLNKLENAGVQFSFLQTNDKIWQLHHNKFMIFNFENGSSALHTGAGNFTYSAFTKNYENFYFIKIPAVVDAFKEQYEKLYNQLGTYPEKLPETYLKE